MKRLWIFTVILAMMVSFVPINVLDVHGTGLDSDNGNTAANGDNGNGVNNGGNGNNGNNGNNGDNGEGNGYDNGETPVPSPSPEPTPSPSPTHEDDDPWVSWPSIEATPRPTPQPPPTRVAATPRPQAPNVRLVQPQSIVLTPGEVVEVDVIVRNIGRGQAANTLVTASSDGPFSVEFINNSNVLGSVGENSNRTIRMRLHTDPNAEGGAYSLDLQFAFRTQSGDANEVSNDTISVRIDRQAERPQVTLQNFSTINEIFPGNSFTITAQLANIGEGSAYSVQVAIAEGLDPSGIFLSGSPTAPFLQSMAPGHSNMISFSFTASNRISSGTFPIVFEVTGRDRAGNDISDFQTTRFTYFVTVVAPQEGTNRAFISISTAGPGGVIGVNGRAYVSMTVSNTGTLPARNIRISATPVDVTAIVPASASVQTIGLLEPGDTQSMSFAFSPTADAASQYHMVGFEVMYETGAVGNGGTGTSGNGFETDSFEQFIGINVYNPDSDNGNQGSRPRILVSNYSVTPMIVSAGEEFDLYLTFQNTSSTRSVYNIRMTLDAVEYAEGAGAVFTTVGASNSIFVESLGPRQESSHVLRMFTVPNADPRTYNIEVTFDYEDSDFESFEEVERLSINVQQVARLELGALLVPDFASAFQPVFVDFQIRNTGRVTLHNLRIEAEGNFDVTNMEIFVGDMGRGVAADYSGHFVPIEMGEQQGAIIVSGEDSIGTLIEARHEFTIFVEDMPMWDENDMWGDEMMYRNGMMEEEGGLFEVIGRIGLWVLGAIVVIGAGAAAVIIYLRKKRNNKDIFSDLQ